MNRKKRRSADLDSVSIRELANTKTERILPLLNIMPLTNKKTIAAVSNPRERHTTKERAPLTGEEKTQRQEESARKQAEIDAAVRKSYSLCVF
jgi:hypothetical protein